LARPYLSLDPLLSPAHLPRPVDWRAEFGRDAPLELEIGSGNGEYLVRLAAARPDCDFVGLEYKWGRVKKTLRKIGLARAGNARVLYGEAYLALERLFPPRSLAGVHALFPCPWPGDVAGRHRLFSRPFLRLLNSRLAAGGATTIVTDDRDYADWVLGELPGTGFEGALRVVGADYGTKFEQKWQSGGQEAFFRLDLVKREHVEVALKEDVPMRIHWIDRFDPAALSPAALGSAALGSAASIPADQPGDNAICLFKGNLYDPVRRIGMVQTVVVEDRLTQEFWIELVPDKRGWRIAPARGCHVVMTDGVQRALDLVYAAAGGGTDPVRVPDAAADGGRGVGEG
jgi:tRNA (guanine-N7-)-methyltransferase